MAATANHPDGNFVGAVEPNEDIAAIAQQISDHAEVIYQTWKAKGLAPNEILTCHNNLNVANKFGSVLTPKFRSVNANKSDPSTPMTDILYNNNAAAPMNTNSLEQFVQKFVVEDKARLATRQKNADTPCALSTAKNYPSSIQYALQKFEKNSPNTAANNFGKVASMVKKSTSPKVKTRAFSSVAGAKLDEACTPLRNDLYSTKTNNVNHLNTVHDGLSTWPVKNKAWNNELLNSGGRVTPDNNVEFLMKSTTLPTKKERNGVLSKNFIDEVAKEEEKLIHALKTGAIISAVPESESESRVDSFDVKTRVPNKLQIKSPDGGSFKHSIISAALQNLSKKSDTSNLGYMVESNRRKRRNGAQEISNGDAVNEHSKTNGSANCGNQNGNNQNGNPVRPFLTRGSVAERVMMFEKCPTEILEKRGKTNDINSGSWKHLASDVHRKIQNYSKETTDQKSATHPPHTTLQRRTKANKNVFIPRFHYPHGKPITPQQQNIIFKDIEDVFRSFADSQVTMEQFASITKACGCPLYWKAALFIACGGEKLGHIDMNTFLDYWRNLTATCHDDASRFMRIVTRSTSRTHIIPEDLIPLIQDVVNTHPGLTFLKQAPEFHSRYVHTVICRVYYCVNQSWNGQISLAELRKSDFLRAVQLLEEEEDINQITAYFSYEHFYVIYCKFWELDRDHDLFISKDDLARHSDHALSSRIIDRIFSRTKSKSRNSMLPEGKMSYTDFVIFLLAEEDKRHPRAIEYWFRCMDIDGDGFLSMYELEHFYDEQLQRMEAMGIECLPFEDCLCQMLDMIQPKFRDKISLSDLKRCKMTPIFFDTFFNLEKYLDHEQRDPFASQRDHDNDMSDWDRYAAEEYELLVAEESGNDQCDDIRQCSVTENVDDIFSSNLDDILNSPQEFVDNDIDTIPTTTAYGRSQEDVNSAIIFQNLNNYVTKGQMKPSMSLSTYQEGPMGVKGEHSDSSDDYAGDSDDCSL